MTIPAARGPLRRRLRVARGRARLDTGHAVAPTSSSASSMKACRSTIRCSVLTSSAISRTTRRPPAATRSPAHTPPESRPAASSEVERFSGVAPDARILPVRFTQRHRPAGARPRARHRIRGGNGRLHHQRLARRRSRATRRCSAPSSTPPRAMCWWCVRRPTRAARWRWPTMIACPTRSTCCRSASNGSRWRAAHASLRIWPRPGFARVPQWRGSGHSTLLGNAIGAAYVSGCAALVKTLNPAWGYHEIKEHLLASSTSHPELEGRCQTAARAQRGQRRAGPHRTRGRRAARSPGRRSTTRCSNGSCVIARRCARTRGAVSAAWRRALARARRRARRRAEDDHPRQRVAPLLGHAAHRLPRVQLLDRGSRADDCLKWCQAPFSRKRCLSPFPSGRSARKSCGSAGPANRAWPAPHRTARANR